MDHDKEIYALSAQTLAFEAVVANVFYQLGKADPRFAAAVIQGFDNAASFVENFAISKGKTAASEHIVKALAIVEELRTASLGHHDKPRHGV